MTDRVLRDTLRQLFSSIDFCIERKVQLPTLILLYSAIDGLAWLSIEDNRQVRQRFEKWVEAYLFSARSFGCSATDLYAARCGILHTFTGNSRLLEQGNAKSIAYAWGDADVGRLQVRLDQAHPGRCTAIHIRHLADAVKLATETMFETAARNEALARRLTERGKRYFQPVTKTFQAGVVYTGADPAVPEGH